MCFIRCTTVIFYDFTVLYRPHVQYLCEVFHLKRSCLCCRLLLCTNSLASSFYHSHFIIFFISLQAHITWDTAFSLSALSSLLWSCPSNSVEIGCLNQFPCCLEYAGTGVLCWLGTPNDKCPFELWRAFFFLWAAILIMGYSVGPCVCCLCRDMCLGGHPYYVFASCFLDGGGRASGSHPRLLPLSSLCCWLDLSTLAYFYCMYLWGWGFVGDCDFGLQPFQLEYFLPLTL